MSNQDGRKTITINDESYYIDSITETGKNLVNSIQKIEKIIEQHEIELQIGQMAKAKLFNDLIRETAQFEQVQKEAI